MTNRKVEPTVKEYEGSWRRHFTDDNSFLRQTRKMNLRVIPRKLEESGKILGKNLWVRAHSKETPLKRLLEREIAPVELNGLKDLRTLK